MTLLWILIFGGMFLIVEWFMIARGTASALVQILHNVYYQIEVFIFGIAALFILSQIWP